MGSVLRGSGRASGYGGANSLQALQERAHVVSDGIAAIDVEHRQFLVDCRDRPVQQVSD
jgi:hypothetical protein